MLCILPGGFLVSRLISGLVSGPNCNTRTLHVLLDFSEPLSVEHKTFALPRASKCSEPGPRPIEKKNSSDHFYITRVHSITETAKKKTETFFQPLNVCQLVKGFTCCFFTPFIPSQQRSFCHPFPSPQRSPTLFETSAFSSNLCKVTGSID